MRGADAPPGARARRAAWATTYPRVRRTSTCRFRDPRDAGARYTAAAHRSADSGGVLYCLYLFVASVGAQTLVKCSRTAFGKGITRRDMGCHRFIR